ncbi:hypothetical protein BRARA_C03941 [Brassica rapa]|uniref:CCHC-type domain-containing protein n=1 Tax=Brassica campestris TaxID=3711 RepID=A0A398A9U2_BRACM|nr:hypothetical protein BRARA_C03941 [Brassica rapa]
MASPENPSSEINGGTITGEEIQLQDHSKITSSDSEARLSLEKMSVKSAVSLNSDKSLAPSVVTSDILQTGCAVEETSREVDQLISESTPELAGSTFPQPHLQGAWTKPLVIAGAVGSSTIALHNTAMENSEWPALSTKDTSRKKDHAVVVRSKVLKQSSQVDDSSTQRIRLPTDKVRFPWAARMNPQTRNLHCVTVPEYMEDGTPKFVLQRSLWHVDDCIMFVAPWTSSDSLTLPEITSIPLWVSLKNIPSTLYSILGIEWIASGLGEPMLSYKPWLDPTMLGEAKIMVEVELDKPFPKKVAAWDKQGNFSLIDVEYAWLPASCERCGQLGHKSKRCLSKVLDISTRTSQEAAVDKRDATLPDTPVPSQAKETMSIPTVQASNSQQYILQAPATDKPATPKEDTSRTCDEMIDKVNSTDVDDLVSLATVSVLENMYESPSVICINETIESPPMESAPTKQQTETSVTQTSTKVCKESSRIQEIDLGSNQFASLTSLEGEEEFQLDLDEGSGPMDLLTPSGKRLLRERPVKPSAKGMEWQSQSMSRGRGNRGRGNRGRLR